MRLVVSLRGKCFRRSNIVAIASLHAGQASSSLAKLRKDRRDNRTSRYYDWRNIQGLKGKLYDARINMRTMEVVQLLRSGLVRNYGNIIAPRLYNRTYSGTKLLIEQFVEEVCAAVRHVAGFTTDLSSSGLTKQDKTDFIQNCQRSLGRTSLILQGGSIFGMCHLGVVKALLLRGLLPTVITGTGTGALIAALVGVHAKKDLLDFLDGDGIDLTAFDRKARAADSNSRNGPIQTILRRMRRFLQTGYFLDVKVLENCVRANVGDLTFEEAYARSGIELNITVVTDEKAGIPEILNHTTTPNVVSISILFPVRPICLLSLTVS